MKNFTGYARCFAAARHAFTTPRHKMDSDLKDVIIIGAGPTGLACAIEAEKSHLNCVVIEKGCIVNSIQNFPVQMTFFTTPELLEIGGLPFVSSYEKPTRLEALKYYRRTADTYHLKLRLYETVLAVEGADGSFRVKTQTRAGAACQLSIKENHPGDRVLRHSQPAENSGRRPPEGRSLLHRGAPLLRHGRGGDRREELSRDCGARSLPSRRARHSHSSWHRTQPEHQILDQAGH